MKLCWDNIENVRLSENGNFRDIVKKQTYYLKICEECGEEFLGYSSTLCCSKECTKVKRSKSMKNKWKDPDSKHNSKKYREQLSKRMKDEWKDPDNKHNSKETRKRMSEAQKGEKGSKWNGGYKLKGIPTYNAYAHQIEWAEEVRRNKEDPNVLEVRCFKCNEWYIPSYDSVSNRLQHLKGNRKWESHFYCSNRCKHTCSVYYKSDKENSVKSNLSREVQPELRQMVLERDKNMCVKCNDSSNLECHHIYPVSTNPLESADIDNCITLCKECHKKVHQEVDGCGYGQLRKIEEC